MARRKQKEGDLVKGDKLRDLILFVHLNQKYNKGKYEVSELKKIFDYGTGGIYYALDDSGYFDRTADEIKLTDKAEKYLKSRILPRYDILKTLGYCLLFVGALLTFQWIDYTYFGQVMVFPWYSNVGFIALGVFMISFVLRTKYFFVKRKKNLTRSASEKGKRALEVSC